MLELREHQQAVVDKLRAGFEAGHMAQLLYAPTGFGKCLAKGTPVLMASGETLPVEQIRCGHQILGPDGTPRNVLSVCEGRETMYRIIPTKGDPYVVNESHILSLRKTPGTDRIRLSDGSVIEADADVVNVNVRVLHESNKTAKHVLKGWRSDAVQFWGQSEPLAIPPYILGAWLGDGTKSGTAITKPPCKMVDAWHAYAASIGCKVSKYQYSDACPSWAIVKDKEVNSFLAALRSYKLLDEVHIPAIYRFASVQERLELIAGLIDSDGHHVKGCYDWISKDKKMAMDFTFLCRSVGLSAYITECTKGIKERNFTGQYWRVSVSGDTAKIPCLDKPASPRQQKKRDLVHGITIEPIGEGDYYGFTIDGDRLFLLGDFTVTHNTEVAMSIMQATAANFKRAAMVMDRVVLVDQTSRRLTKYGIPHGVLQAQHWRFRPAERIQVCSAQTLEKRAEFPATDLLIIDECHVQRRGVLDYIKAHPSVRVIGLTATPFTKGLGDTYTNVVGATSTGRLIEKGWLTPLKVFIAHEIDMTGAKKIAGEWSQDVAAERGMQITGDIVAEWSTKTHEIFGKPVKTVVFCSNVAHGKDLEKGFKAAGYNFVSISYKEDDDFKREQIEEFSKPDSSIQGLIATDILTRGFDVPDVLIGVSARPFSKSFSSHVQQMGRVMRPHPGKEFAVWLDHAGNYLRFREDWDTLFAEGVTELQSDGEKAKKEPTEKVKKNSKCPRCQALWTRGSLACVECGYVRPNLSMVASVPGQLRELHGANQQIALANQEFYAQVLWYARDRGYKEGWAAHKYKEKFGAFPPRQWGGLEGKAPSRETMSWIRSRVIAYAKGRARA